jgi:PAS domain-containing protein
MASTSIAPPPNGPGPSSGGEPLAGHNSKQPTFEFTRRKRWAELLVNELSEAITLVLSPVGKILFCGPAVTELLGWRDEELIDGDLLELVNGEHFLFAPRRFLVLLLPASAF